MKKISIIIPAHNEAQRIGKTLEHYGSYFNALKQEQKLDYEIIVVLNGCKDFTQEVVAAAGKSYPIALVDLQQAGKGLALAAGFKYALLRSHDFIGFVDADMATKPEHFYDLLINIGAHDGIIASRYMRGAQVYPKRPWIKEWGRKIVYHSLIRLLFGMWYKDLQCGAKIFKRKVIQHIAPQLTVAQWAFDVELLYLCKKHGFSIKEHPTIWHDQAESKLRVMRGGMKMLGALFQIKLRHF